MHSEARHIGSFYFHPFVGENDRQEHCLLPTNTARARLEAVSKFWHSRRISNGRQQSFVFLAVVCHCSSFFRSFKDCMWQERQRSEMDPSFVIISVDWILPLSIWGVWRHCLWVGLPCNPQLVINDAWTFRYSSMLEEGDRRLFLQAKFLTTVHFSWRMRVCSVHGFQVPWHV